MTIHQPIGIQGVGPLSPARPPVQRGRAGAGFQVPEGSRAGQAGAAQVGAAASIAGPSLLSLQDESADEVADREARRHGHAMLAALAALQRGLLDGSGAGTLDQLASLARAAPDAADPRLAGVQKAIQVRAAVELARSRAATSM